MCSIFLLNVPLFSLLVCRFLYDVSAQRALFVSLLSSPCTTLSSSLSPAWLRTRVTTSAGLGGPAFPSRDGGGSRRRSRHSPGVMGPPPPRRQRPVELVAIDRWIQSAPTTADACQSPAEIGDGRGAAAAGGGGGRLTWSPGIQGAPLRRPPRRAPASDGPGGVTADLKPHNRRPNRISDKNAIMRYRLLCRLVCSCSSIKGQLGASLTCCSKWQGLHHEFDIGGGGDGIGTLGRRRRHDIPHLPQFRFLLGFRPLYFAKRHANVFFQKMLKKN